MERFVPLYFATKIMLTSIHLDSWTVQILGEDNPRDIEQASWYMAIEYLCYASWHYIRFRLPNNRSVFRDFIKRIRKLASAFPDVAFWIAWWRYICCCTILQRIRCSSQSELFSNNAVRLDTSTEWRNLQIVPHYTYQQAASHMTPESGGTWWLLSWSASAPLVTRWT